MDYWNTACCLLAVIAASSMNETEMLDEACDAQCETLKLMMPKSH